MTTIQGILVYRVILLSGACLDIAASCCCCCCCGLGICTGDITARCSVVVSCLASESNDSSRPTAAQQVNVNVSYLL